MKPSSRASTGFALSDPLHYRLNAYALAATAASSGWFAAALPAEAEVIYTPAHVSILSHHKLDLNHYHKADFVIENISSTPGSTAAFHLSAKPFGNNAVENNSGKFASALSAGSEIGPQQKFSNVGLMAVHMVPDWTSFTQQSGPWINVKNRYLGLKFELNGKAHYAWARLTVQLGAKFGNIEATLTGYAYETVPNKSIVAGDTKGPDVVTLRSQTGNSSLGGLALGRK
jgi:hypothetical protein